MSTLCIALLLLPANVMAYKALYYIIISHMKVDVPPGLQMALAHCHARLLWGIGQPEQGDNIR